MNISEKYFLLFTDTFYGNFTLSMQEDFAFTVMQKFGENTYFFWTATLLGVLCAGMVNYLLGYVVYNMFIKYASQDTTTRYQEMQSIWKRIYLLPFGLCLIPLGAKIIILFCGVLRFRFLRSLLLLLILKYVYYLSQI